MLRLNDIKTFFPEALHRFPRFMLREYLQYKILEAVFATGHANRLCFPGGTCLRIVHGNRRFSEDLDFDNRGLSADQFNEVADAVGGHLTREGYEVELKQVMRDAWHCHIRFPGLLFEEGLSEHREEKILIQLDTDPQQFEYEPDRIILNRFEVFTTILTTPLSLLFAQKLYSILNRTRKQGRDFYDVVFLMGRRVEPDYSYLREKAGIAGSDSLRHSILDICRSQDMERLAQDVEPFLFDPGAREKVVRFPDYFRQSF